MGGTIGKAVGLATGAAALASAAAAAAAPVAAASAIAPAAPGRWNVPEPRSLLSPRSAAQRALMHSGSPIAPVLSPVPAPQRALLSSAFGGPLPFLSLASPGPSACAVAASAAASPQAPPLSGRPALRRNASRATQTSVL
jgi:hypothetical protein